MSKIPSIRRCSIVVVLGLVAVLVTSPAALVWADPTSPELPGYDCGQAISIPASRAYNYDAATDLLKIVEDSAEFAEIYNSVINHKLETAGTERHLIVRWKNYELGGGSLEWDDYRNKYVLMRDNNRRGYAFEDFFSTEEKLDPKAWNKGKQTNPNRADLFNAASQTGYELKSGSDIRPKQLADYVTAVNGGKLKQIVYVFGSTPTTKALRDIEAANLATTQNRERSAGQPIIPIIVARCWPAAGVPRPASTRGTSDPWTTTSSTATSTTRTQVEPPPGTPPGAPAGAAGGTDPRGGAAAGTGPTERDRVLSTGAIGHSNGVYRNTPEIAGLGQSGRCGEGGDGSAC